MNVRIEKDGNEWVAILPPHPDMPDEELGLPAATREEAEAEARAYEAITQSSLYKFDFDDGRGVYIVSIGKDEKYDAPLLAEAYARAQEAYTKRVSEPPPPDAPAPEPKPKQMRKPRQQGNGAKQQEPEPIPQVSAPEPEPPHAKQEVLPPEQAITSGKQLYDAASRARIDRLEMILVAFARTIIKEIKEGA